MSSSSTSTPITATLSDSSEQGKHVLPPAMPPATTPPGGGRWDMAKGLVRYLVQSEVHTYAFSVAANAILSIFPFIALMYFLARRVFHSRGMEDSIGTMVHFFLPTAQDFIVRNSEAWLSKNHHLSLISIITLFIACTGIFLPLEVALNQVWAVTKNRSYVMNQLISLSLALLMVVLAMGSATLGVVQRTLLADLFFQHTNNVVYETTVQFWLGGTTVIAGILLFFFTYWLLPNRKLPARAVMPAAVVTGLLWAAAKYVYMAALPYLDLDPKLNGSGSYGPFYFSVGIILWGYISGLLMLGGAHYSATRYTLRMAHEVDVEEERAKHGGA